MRPSPTSADASPARGWAAATSTRRSRQPGSGLASWAHGQPRSRRAGEQPAEADVGAGAEPGVGPRLDQRHPGRQAGAHPVERRGRRAVVDHHDAGHQALGEEAVDCRQHGDRLVAVHDDEVDGVGPRPDPGGLGRVGASLADVPAAAAPAWSGARGAALGSPLRDRARHRTRRRPAPARLLRRRPRRTTRCHRGGAAGRGRVQRLAEDGVARRRAAGTSCGGTLVAWATAAGHEPHEGFRIVGAHTDSPNLRIKPQPDVVRAGVRQLGVEAYGGVLLTSWLDRDLGLSGRVAVRRNGTGAMVRLLRVDRPVCAIPARHPPRPRRQHLRPRRRRAAPPHPAVGHRPAEGGRALGGHRDRRPGRLRGPRAGGRRRPTCWAGT